jgi:hypothetical protein
LGKVGRPLEDIVTSPAYANLLAVGIMARRAAAGAASRVVSGLFSPVRRVANVPSRDDVLRLSHQLETLTAEVRALAAAQREAPAPARSAGTRAARGRRVTEPSEPKASGGEHAG